MNYYFIGIDKLKIVKQKPFLNSDVNIYKNTYALKISSF